MQCLDQTKPAETRRLSQTARRKVCQAIHADWQQAPELRSRFCGEGTASTPLESVELRLKLTEGSRPELANSYFTTQADPDFRE